MLASRFLRTDAEESIQPSSGIEPTSADRYEVPFTADAEIPTCGSTFDCAARIDE